jgi:proteasome accessory factor C
MEFLHRFYKLHNLLKSRRQPISRREIELQLECAPATAKRIIRELRNRDAPIESVRGQGYRYAAGTMFELPGLWFTPSQLVSLLVAQRLLADAEPGLLAAELAPLRHKLERLLNAEHLGGGELSRRVRILRMAGRGVGQQFEAVVLALVQRKRLDITYRSRTHDRSTERAISPQRLVRYRDNWYLDAWCHLRKGLRSFAIERIESARPLATAAREVAERALDRHYAASYGIFAGKPTAVAILRFSAAHARWVADEAWHPQQQGRYLADGCYELRVPYSNPHELVMDVLRHGEHVEVMAPPELRVEVLSRLLRASKLYGDRIAG